MYISVVIITKDEAENIVECIQSARQISDDVIVVDSGSLDGTVAMAREHGAKMVQVAWSGFGNARNAGAELACNDWILSLDADERITGELADSINRLNLQNPSMVYGFKRQNYLLDKKIHFGDWGRDKVFRLYCRSSTEWNLFPVHESLLTEEIQRKMITGNLEHYVTKSIDRDREKLIRYAKLCAKKYCLLGRKATLINMIFSPLFNFINGYIFRFGFLDGKEGFGIAKSNAYYTWLKYNYLHQLSKTIRQSFFLSERI